MARRPSNIIRFPGSRTGGILVTDAEYALLCDVVGPYHGIEIRELLQRAASTKGGRRILGTNDDLALVMEAIGAEAYGFHRVEEENAGRPLEVPKRGGTAARLFAIYDRLEEQLS